MTDEQVILRNQYVIMSAMARGVDVPTKTKDELLSAMVETEAALERKTAEPLTIDQGRKMY